ncbi:uncharacterized protein [Ptychodera flava]|uniref:uncharacterized protein n=1 Tax=Ptychodera flava TaxID=63121 RepID=UPI00396AAE5E
MASALVESVAEGKKHKKQILCVSTKLQSYKTAQEEVKTLLGEVVDSNDVDIVIHDDKKQYGDALAVTAIVVIDVRQTRTLITPSRRDQNVDHWDELRDLTTGITDPPGSVLIFLYGDEKSKQLEDERSKGKDEQLNESLPVCENWMTTWKYNDECAYAIAQRKRVFSLMDALNEKQKKSLKEYLDIVPLFPRRRASTNVLLLGTQEVRKEYCQYLDEHPFIHQTAFNRETSKAEYRYFNYNHEKTLASGPSISVHFGDTGMPIKLCDSDVQVHVALSEQVSEGHLNGRGIGYKSKGERTCCSPVCCMGCPSSRCHASIIDIDRVLVSCHCEMCFQKAMDQQEEISTFIKTELRKVGFDAHGDVLPFLANNQATDKTFGTEKYRSAIMDMKKKVPEEHLHEKQHRLNKMSPEIVKKMFVYQSAQTPAVRLHSRIEISTACNRQSPPTWVHVMLIVGVILVVGTAYVLVVKFVILEMI